MKKGLFILFEGLAETVIDSQVFIHALEMKRNGIVDFEIWSFAGQTDLYRKSQARLESVQQLSQCRVRLFRGVRPLVPFSIFWNALLLLIHVVRFRPQFELLHARNEYSACVARYLKLFRRFCLICDYRGASVPEFTLRYQPDSLLEKWAGRVQEWRLWRRVTLSAHTCDHAIFVTQALKEYVGADFQNKPFAIIPCSASTEKFYYDPELRRATRTQCGYLPAHKVLIYSGSLTFYQCFEESVALFAKLYGRDANFRLLILTPQVADAKAKLASLPPEVVQISHAPFEQVNAFLNAADYAIMLREDNMINRVASPTKFAEYALTGLPIIMSGSVVDSCQMAKEVGNLCEYNAGDVHLIEAADRRHISAAYQQRLSRAAILARYQAVYSP